MWLLQPAACSGADAPSLARIGKPAKQAKRRVSMGDVQLENPAEEEIAAVLDLVGAENITQSKHLLRQRPLHQDSQVV